MPASPDSRGWQLLQMAFLFSPYQNKPAASSSGGTPSSRHPPSSQAEDAAESRHQPLHEGGAASEPSLRSLLLSLIEQLRNGYLPVVVMMPFASTPLPSCQRLRRLSLPSDNPAHLAEIQGVPLLFALVANPTAPAPASAPTSAPGNPRTAAAMGVPMGVFMDAPVSGHAGSRRSNALRTPQSSDAPPTKHIFREDITPSSPTESWAESDWRTPRDWDPPRSYH